MQFEHSGWLVLLVLLVPVLWRSRGAKVTLGPIRGVLVPILRCLLITTLVLALADPVLVRTSDRLTVAVVLDRSASLSSAEVDHAVQWLQDATRDRGESDLLAVVHAAREPSAVMMPDAYGQVGIDPLQGERDGTNLASAIEFAKGLLPEDGRHRILLVSDGNETVGSVLEAAGRAAEAGIPIDVLPITYHRKGEVMVERLIAPREVRPGTAVDLRAVLRSESAASGTLQLLRGGVPISSGIPVELQAGMTVVPLTVPAGGGATQRYDVVFEPAQGSGDLKTRNNRAAAVTLRAGEGRVLLVSDGGVGAAHLASQLSGRGLSVSMAGVESLLGGPPALAGWDAIALVNIPRWSLPEHVDAELADWVRRGGGGLLVTGGPTSLGAGGWIGSQLAEVLPVGLDPPAEKQVRRGALAVILHACEMPQGNVWGRRVAEASIEALSSVDLIGLIEYNNRMGSSEWAFPLTQAGDKRAALRAAASLNYGDMPDFAEPMDLALRGLDGVDAGQRHVIIISDGDPQPPGPELLDAFVRAQVSVSTVMVGGHGTPTDRRRMAAMASMTGGRFHDVQDATQLPRIFIQEAQVVSRSLLQTGQFQPSWTGPGGGPVSSGIMSTIGEIPAIHGYVLTESLGGLAADSMVVPGTQGPDPLFVWGSRGLGRVVVFTSEVGGTWTQQWSDWAGSRLLWDRTIAWLLRPGDDGLLAMSLRQGDDGEVHIDLETVTADAGIANFLQTDASVLGPGGRGESLSLQQVGPGRYRGSFRMDQSGGWIVGVRYRGIDPSTGEPIEGWVQGSIIHNWSDEDAAVRSNAILLEEAARRSGGRVLSLESDPTEAVIFERTGLDVTAGQRSTWALLAAIAGVLLLIDVGVRRIVPDRQRREVLAARRATDVLASTARSTESAWKRVRRQARSGQALGDSPKMDDNEPPQENGDSDSTLSQLRAARQRRLDEGDDS